MSERTLIFRITAYTGKDLLLYLLPVRWQAAVLARRAEHALDLNVELPCGLWYKMSNGTATPSRKPEGV